MRAKRSGPSRRYRHLIFDALVAGQIRRNPFGAILTSAAIAFGVASYVAANVTNAYADRAIKTSVLGASEHADLQIARLGGRLNPSILRAVRAVPGVSEARPVIEGSVTLRTRRAAEATVHVEGIDVLQSFAGSNSLRSYDPGPFAPPEPIEIAMIEQRGVIVSRTVANALSLDDGGTMHTVAANNSPVTLKVVSILPVRTSGLDSNTVLVDLTTASGLFGSHGALDRIDVVADRSELEAVSRRIARVLPKDAQVKSATERIASLDRLTYGVRFNLSVFSYVALALGAVLVANSVGISVRQRRPEIAILRSLGASRAQIARAFLAEGALLGALGGIVGAILGDAFAEASSGFADPSSLIETGSQLAGDTSILIRGMCAGLLLCTSAAVAPAIEAAYVLPANALRVTPKRQTGPTDKRSVAIGLAIALVSVALGFFSRPGSRAAIAYASALGVLLGIGLCVPSALRIAVRAGSRIANNSVPGALAVARLRAHGMRLSLAVITLVIAVTTSIGIATATVSFERTTHEWERIEKPGDLEVRLLGNRHEITAGVLASRISRLPGVAAALLVKGGEARPARDSPVGSITVIATPGGSLDALRRAIIATAAPAQVDVRSSREARAADEALLRPSLSLASTVGRVSIIIAVVSSVATMIALVQEQRRELLLLRILGLAIVAMRRMIVYEAAFLAAFGALLGAVAGLGLGALLVLVIDPLVSGYRVSLELPLGIAVGTPIAIVAAAMLAAIVPAQLATSKSDARALQST